MKDNLKPCPFCGSRAEIENEPKEISDGENWLHVVCTECSSNSGYYLSKESAREAWNMRCDND